MIEEIADIVDEYNRQKRYPDNAFVNRICISYINANKLNKYLKDVRTDDISLKNGGSNYNPFTKVLAVDLTGGRIPLLQIVLRDKYLYFENLQKLRMVLHELNHVVEERTLENNDGSIEFELVKLNNYNYFYPMYMKEDNPTIIDTLKGRIKLFRYGMYYNRNHDLAPIERIADIRSYNMTYEILKKIDTKKIDRAYTEFVYYACKNMNDTLERGYKMMGDKSNSPSIDFLKGLKDLRYIVDEYDFDEESKKLSFEDKVLYGMKLNKEEFYNTESLNPYANMLRR